MRTALSLALLLACGGDPSPKTSAGPSPSCDGLDPSVCALPYPSSFYETPSDTGSGIQVAFPDGALPVNRDAVPLRPAAWNERDGWSILTPAITWMGDVSLDGVIRHDDLGAYAADDARTVLVNTVTGERVPHFVELDMTAPPGERLLVLRPVVPMDYGTRHVIGIRDLSMADGSTFVPSDGFLALRDGGKTSDNGIENRRDHFETVIFPTLADQGFPRDTLQIAWDFTTGSEDGILGRVLSMRDDARSSWGDEGPAYTIDSVEDHDCKEDGVTIGRTVEGTLTIPLYTDTDGPGAVLTRGDDGLPFRNGEARSPFLVRIPCSVTEDPSEPAFLVQYGHGLLGSRYESLTEWLGGFQDTHRLVTFAQDWKGMSEQDAGFITLLLAFDVSDFRTLPERSQQGLVELVAGLDLARGALVDDPALAVDGVPVLDPERFGYYGISQGGIMGGAYLGISPVLERGVLGVSGMPYALLLSRSANFDPFFLIFKEKYTDGREMALILMLLQTLWDPAESSGYAHALRAMPLPGTPPKDVLLQAAIGDAQVTALATHIQARAWDVPTLAPQTRPIWGVEESEPGFSGSALVEWRYDTGPEEPFENLPPDTQGDTHECVRREPAAQQQLIDFLFEGVVNQYCDGPCVAATCP